jgi:hypothetical protein
MPMIDAIDALGLLDECVRDQAAGRYTPEEASAPGALLAVAVSRALTDARGLLEMPLAPEAWAKDAVTKRETISIGALVALRAADRRQRAGGCWACSAAAARRSVLAYVDLLPGRLWQEAADERRRRVPAAHITPVKTESRHRCSSWLRVNDERCRGTRARRT